MDNLTKKERVAILAMLVTLDNNREILITGEAILANIEKQIGCSIALLTAKMMKDLEETYGKSKD